MSNRELTEHRVNPVNDKIEIRVLDEPGAGGANHVYHVILPPNAANEVLTTTLAFQNGPIGEVGINGITQEVLLAIISDRLRSFQAGPFACKENGAALEHVQRAMDWLHQRALARMERGVEGTHTP